MSANKHWKELYSPLLIYVRLADNNKAVLYIFRGLMYLNVMVLASADSHLQLGGSITTRHVVNALYVLTHSNFYRLQYLYTATAYNYRIFSVIK